MVVADVGMAADAVYASTLIVGVEERWEAVVNLDVASVVDDADDADGADARPSRSDIKAVP